MNPVKFLLLPFTTPHCEMTITIQLLGITEGLVAIITVLWIVQTLSSKKD